MTDEQQPTDSEELTPADEKKFGKFLDKFLAEDDTPTHTPAPPTPRVPSPAPSAAPTGDLSSAINAALDARESKSKDTEWRAGIEGALDELSRPKKKKWYEPWTLFSGVM